MTTIDGSVEPGFEGVRDAFARNFSDHGDVGAAFSLYVEGRKVVDLWGGLANDKTGDPWNEDTAALVFSTTKGVTAIAAHHLAQAGALDLDAPVADVWPEFAAEGKGAVTTRMLLGHRAGLPTIEAGCTQQELFDWSPACEKLAAQKPLWEPDTAHGYHAVTYGNLVGEVIRRVSGRTVGQYLAGEIAKPLDVDVWIGLPEEEDSRVARLIQTPPQAPTKEMLAELTPAALEMMKAMADPTSITVRALNPTQPPLRFNDRAVRAAEIPAGAGVATARGLAKLYASCVGEVDGIRLLEPATVEDASREVSNGPDKVLMTPTRFGAGFFLSSAFSPLLGARSFGHAGAGGSLAFADPDAEVGFGYVMSKMQQSLNGDQRTLGLIEAVRAAL